MNDAPPIRPPRQHPSSFSPRRWLSDIPFSLLLTFILLSGCSSPRPPEAREPAAGLPGGLAVLGAQYAVSTGADAGHNTFEVYLWNGGPREVVFAGGSLDGRELPSLDRGALDLMAKHFSFALDGASSPATAAPLPPPDGRVTWWQFYPSPAVPPGGAAVCQVNFRGAAAPATLALRESGGAEHAVAVPRFRQPDLRVTAVTWSPDGRTVFVQYDARGSALEILKVGNRAVRPAAVLRPARPGLPEVAVVPAPGGRAVGRGEPVLLELAFAGGGVRRALVRAAPGIMLDAPRGMESGGTLPAAVRDAYGLDADPAVACLPFDAACGDTRAGVPGAAAPAVCAARLAALRRDPGRLAGVEVCTARYAAIWNIYAPLADALIVKPYQLHWGPDPARFIENEEALIETAVAAAAPRPAVWVPERFKRERHVEGAELRVLAWTALALGVKGVRYHYWMNDPDEPFKECPGLGEGMKALNAAIRRLAPVLGPLVPVDSRLDRAQRVKVYEGWSGDAGALLLVRNMDYRTDARADGGGLAPRFRAAPARDVAIAFEAPPWLDPADPADPLSGEPYPHARAAGSISITVPELDDVRLVWLENRGRATARGNERSAP